jgi:hypothetical protein
MNIIIRLKPRVYTAKSKSGLISKLPFGFPTISTYGNYLSSNSRVPIAIVYNMTKVNKKTKQIKDSHNNTIKSIVIREKMWTANVYEIELDLLNIAKLKVIQELNNFKFKPNMR